MNTHAMHRTVSITATHAPHVARPAMRDSLVLMLAAILLPAITNITQADGYVPSAKPGQYKVETVSAEWIDTARQDRKVPVKVYYPAGTDARPVIIFSHGLGGSRDGYEFIGSFWASHGYTSVHPQHLGSDDSVWKGVPPRDIMSEMRKAAMNPMAAMNRPKDVTFVIDTLEKQNKDAKSPLHKRLDLDKLAMAGHSFGSWTTLAVGGLSAGPLGQAGHDKRIKAMIPMSSPAVKMESQQAAAYGKIAIPALHMTGTLDDSPIGDTSAKDRRVPYDHSPGPRDKGADCYLIIFEGGDHAIFSGANRSRLRERIQGSKGGDGAKDETFHKLIFQTSLAFLDAYIMGNKDAKQWLQGDAGMKATLGKTATLEMKK